MLQFNNSLFCCIKVLLNSYTFDIVISVIGFILLLEFPTDSLILVSNSMLQMSILPLNFLTILVHVI